MPLKPVKQISTIIRQQYFEPTISWSFRVVLALNVPLILIPLYKGFSYEVIWAAFGAYMLSLIDYRGLHYKKIVIQSITAVLVFFSSLLGMYVSGSVLLSVVAMFVVGMLAAIIRNWSDYGPSIAVSAGFFFLFGLATPVSFPESLEYGVYLLAGCAWAILITILSFPFQPSNPLRRSVAGIWKANTDLLDLIIQKLMRGEEVSLHKITEKEMAVRKLVDQSRNLFGARQKPHSRMKAEHYDQMLGLRKTASLFAATLSSMHEELEVMNAKAFQTDKDVSFYKALSAFAQASARMSVVIFTFRPDDLTMAKIKVERCEVAVELFLKSLKHLSLTAKEETAIQHFTATLYHALEYLQQTIRQIETKLGLQKSDYLENYKLSFHEFIAGIHPRALGVLLKELMNLNTRQFSYAFRVAVGLSLGVFIFKYFQIDHGYWIPLTMMIVIQPYYGATLKKGIERMVGTVGGILVGGGILLLPLSHETSIVILVIDSFFVAYFLRNNYKVGVFFVTIMMVLLMQISQQGTWALIGWRIVSTLFGALLALVAGYAFWPKWEKDRFPKLMAEAVLKNKDYLLHVVQYLQQELAAGDSWYKLRRLVEGANNLVFTSAQRMLEEPERARAQADLNFSLVGANIRMSREITSLALQAENEGLHLKTQLNDFQTKVAQVFDQVALRLSENGTETVRPDFDGLKAGLAQAKFDDNDDMQFIKTELEKIIFELEAIYLLLGKRHH